MKYIVTLNNKNYEIEVDKSEAKLVSVSDALAAPVASVATAIAEAPAAQTAPAVPAASVSQAAPQAPAAQVSESAGILIKAPMPGTIFGISASVGQKVSKGDVLLVLEAMKMENEIFAPSDGTVSRIVVSKGSSVNTDDLLIVLN